MRTYFETAGRDHHADEEEDLFPRLRRLGPGLEALLARLAGEHRALERLWARLAPGLEAEGRRDAHWRAAAAEWCERSEAHVALEDAELLPAARRLLRPDDLEALGRTMAARRGVAYPEG